MKIGIEINGVLRDIVTKMEQVYQKYLIDEMEEEPEFVYEMNLPVTSFEFGSHFKFKDDDEFYHFLYEEFVMQLFGHAPSTEMTSFNTLNDFYVNFRDNYEILIVSNEIGKSKPSSLFFLSKFGCLLEKVIFFGEITKTNMWNNVDILLTANPDLLLNKPSKKVVIKYETEFNKNIESEHTIKSLSEFEDKLTKIIENV